MQSVNDNRKERVDAVINQVLEMADRLFLAHVEAKALLDLENRVMALPHQRGNTGFAHEVE